MTEPDLLPLTTARTVMRPFTPADAPVLARYRDDPDVARFQDWDLPYTIEDAHALIAGQAEQTGPAPGAWFQIAIEHDGELAGDVAIGLDDTGESAMIGYSLRADRQRLGLATEAIEALIDRMFEQGLHRVAATLDPENVASARLLERLGFRYEGRGVSMARVRGEWLDDDRYALLSSDRAEWLARPTTCAADVSLVEVTPANLDAVRRLATHHSQERFVAPMAKSFAQALVPDVIDGVLLVPWYRAVVADGEIAGFVMITESTDAHPDPYLWRLLIDRRHQRRGIGARAVAEVAERVRALGATRLVVSWSPGQGSPEPFYLGLGFVPTGEVEEGEIVAALALAT